MFREVNYVLLYKGSFLIQTTEVKMLKRIAAFLTSLMFVFPSSGYSWGNKGHQTVGRIAQLFLQDDNAQTTLDKIQAILKPGESLATIATWADTVKFVHFGPDVVVSDKDTQAFRRDLRNKNNRVWHFDDLPLDCPSYDACGDVYVPSHLYDAEDLGRAG